MSKPEDNLVNSLEGILKQIDDFIEATSHLERRQSFSDERVARLQTRVNDLVERIERLESRFLD